MAQYKTGIKKRAARVRYKLRSVAKNGKLRLSIYRSGMNIYAQVIDDDKGTTLVSASTLDKKLRSSIKKASTVGAAKQVGVEIAKRASSAGIKEVYFDRGGCQYQGRVKALGDAARAGGLSF